MPSASGSGRPLAATLLALLVFCGCGGAGARSEDVAAELAPGRVAIDALPWGEIVVLERVGGDASPPTPSPSPSRFTPVVLSLPPADYRIALRYPPTGELEELLLTVETDRRVDRRIVFEPLDGKTYFQRVAR